MWSKASLTRTPLAMLSALLLLAGFATAHAETFGRTSVGTVASGGLRADVKRGSKFALPEAGTATNICAWIDTGGTNSTEAQPFRFVLYRDANGAPGAKLAQTSETRLYSNTINPRWFCLDIAWTPLTAGNYWLMIHSGGSQPNGAVRYFYDGAANYVANTDSYADGAADPAGSVSGGNGTMSIYATYTPATQLQHTGVTTIGASASGGLRADFKRGSSITFPQAGKVTALTAYIEDAQPGIDGSQGIQLALYEDVNGVPGPLVTQSARRGISGNDAGRWYTFPTPDGIVHAGKYWLMIHSDGVTGTLRYRYQGTGNWFGNGDVYYDGASNPFGTAGAGDGSISAYASYQPGTGLPKTLGYTSIGTQTEVAGPAYNEASRFRLVPAGATLNSLYAYLDGKGGGTGTQQVRMVVYGDQAFPFGPNAAGVILSSNVVEIPAGQEPGWVKFDITPTALPPGQYWISVHTGFASGIVRRYRDDIGTSNHVYEDIFADGPNSSFINNDGELQGGDAQFSVYATYTTN